MGALQSLWKAQPSPEDSVTEDSPKTNDPALTQAVPVSGSDITEADTTDHPDCCTEVDRRNIIVKSVGGKTVQVDVFPQERIMELLKQACQLLQKKEACMKIVYNGEELDVNKTIKEANLRAGCTVNLIRTC